MDKRFLFSVSVMSHILFGFSILSIMMFSTSIDAFAAGTLYAKPVPTGDADCSSWSNACTLQTALIQAVPGDEIWVAGGVYYPGTNREDSFLMESGVQVYGGFAGTETQLEERDWFANPTVLSGDIDHNDINTDNNFLAETPNDIQGANAYHLLVGSGADATAVFDGFILNAGQADGTTLYHNNGAGVYLTLGNPTLNNLVISANTASGQGGAIYNDRSNATLSNLAVRGNQVTGYGHPGGGMFNHSGSPILSNVLFSGNYAYYAAGLYTDGGNPSLINVTFSGNRTDYNATMHVAGGAPTLVNTIFWGNNNTISGGTPTVTYSIVQNGYTGEGNLDVDPLFVDARSYGEAPTTAGDYRLQYNSPAIEVGNNSPVTALTDLDNNPRLVDGNGDASTVVDLGVYEWQAYTLTVNIEGGGTVIKDPDRSTFGYLEQVSLTASADTGWIFSGWSGDVESTDNQLTITMEANTSITANFIQIEYTLTITPVGSGTVTVEPLQATYHYGDVVTLTPEPDPGWSFDSWGGDATGTDDPLSYTILGDTSITATFTQDEYLLTVTPIGSGTVTIEPMQATYHYGEEVTLFAIPEASWLFYGWDGDATGTENPLTIMIVDHTNITATFITFGNYLPFITR
ncbi:MAG: hypothetical protein ABFD05_05115 [Anaerolineaceae bacterium]